MQENVKKCKNFLATLIKLASHNSPSPDTSKNVKALVQDLLVSPRLLATISRSLTAELTCACLCVCVFRMQRLSPRSSPLSCRLS